MDRVGRLFEANARRAWGLARSLTRTAEDADDLVQQAFTIAVTKRADIPDDAWPWLAKVVAYCARNQHRYRARRQGMEDVHEAEISGHEPDPADAAGKRELTQTLHAALDELSHDEREAVALCHIGGLSQSQACLVVGVELNTLKARVRRGLQHLQQKLALPEAGVAAYLSGIAFPPPAGGWEQSLARWERHARGSAGGSPAPLPVAALKLFGLAALGAMAGVGIWLGVHTLNIGADRAISPVAAGDRVADSPSVQPVSFVAGPQGGESRTPTTAGEVAEPTATLKGKPEAKTGTPESSSKAPTTPRSDEPVGSIQIRTILYANKRIETQWTELITPGKAIKHGLYLHLWPNGNVMDTGNYENDLREGPWTFRYEDNVMSCEGAFHLDKPEGVWKTFDELGNPESEGRYENGLHVGEWLTLHPNGQKALIQHFVLDQLNGLETEFDDQGRKRRETMWVDNQKDGPEILYAENGDEISRKLFKQGK